MLRCACANCGPTILPAGKRNDACYGVFRTALRCPPASSYPFSRSLSFSAAPRRRSCRSSPRSAPSPQLAEPNETLIPTVKIAPAKGWPEGAKPLAAPGLEVRAFATGLDHPRWLYVLPNGDVLVAETNAPERPEEFKGVKGRVMKKVMKRAGAAAPSANRITLLRDADGDGVPETRTAFLENLNSPFGMALVGETLYVANTDAVVAFPYRAAKRDPSRRPGKSPTCPAGRSITTGPRT